MRDELFQLMRGRSGHFQMESGCHTDRWYELERLFDEPMRLRPFVTALAERLRPHHAEIVCGPAVGGAKLARLIAAELTLPNISTTRGQRRTGEALFPVTYEIAAGDRALVRGKSVIVVDDAISAGSAVRSSCAALVSTGARPVALGALIVFGNAIASYASEHRLPVEALVREPFNLWRPGECPLCLARVPLDAVSDVADESASTGR